MIGAALGALLTYACFLFVSRPAWFPFPITTFGKQFDDQFGKTYIVVAVAFISLHLVLIGAVYLKADSAKFRHHQSKIETLWAAIATATFLFLALEGTRIWAGAHPGTSLPSAASERIEVYAHQFAWSFRYPGPDGTFGRTSPQRINDVLENPFGIDPDDPAGKDDIYSATLMVPENREVLLLLRSRDVIHDFFVRELRFKQDVVPGMEIPYRFRASVPGTYEIACSELCGLGHSQMRSTMVVMPQAAFDQWKREKSLAATTK
jgi:cytochrome c oxidase subunit II